MYKITYRQRASNEYLTSIIWYKERSITTAQKFIEAIDNAIKNIASQPTFYKNTYSIFYEAKTKTFPFSIVYFIDEEEKQIVIVSIFHQKRNPRKKFEDDDA
jgi:plasmid stabilization system protein ParE